MHRIHASYYVLGDAGYIPWVERLSAVLPTYGFHTLALWTCSPYILCVFPEESPSSPLDTPARIFRIRIQTIY